MAELPNHLVLDILKQAFDTKGELLFHFFQGDVSAIKNVSKKEANRLIREQVNDPVTSILVFFYHNNNCLTSQLANQYTSIINDIRKSFTKEPLLPDGNGFIIPCDPKDAADILIRLFEDNRFPISKVYLLHEKKDNWSLHIPQFYKTRVEKIQNEIFKYLFHTDIKKFDSSQFTYMKMDVDVIIKSLPQLDFENFMSKMRHLLKISFEICST